MNIKAYMYKLLKNECNVAFICLFVVTTSLAQNNSIVYNEQNENHGKIILTKMISLGGKGDRYENDLYKMTDIKIDNNGNIYLLLGEECQINKYDRHGNLLFKTGRKGRGPGELLAPQSLYVTEDQQIYVYDYKKYEIIHFNKLGKYLGAVKLRHFINDFVITEKDNIIVLAASPTDKFITYDKSGKIINTFGEMVNGKIPMETMYLNNGVLACAGTSFYYAATQPYYIYKYTTSGKLLSVITKKLPYKIILPDYRISAGDNNTTILTKMTNETKIPQDLCADKNRVYYLTKQYGNMLSLGKTIDVFSKEGKYQLSIELEKNTARAISVANGMMAVIYEPLFIPIPNKNNAAENNIPYIALYKMSD